MRRPGLFVHGQTLDDPCLLHFVTSGEKYAFESAMRTAIGYFCVCSHRATGHCLSLFLKSANRNFVCGGHRNIQTDGAQSENIQSKNIQSESHRDGPMNEMQKKRYGACNA